MASAIAARHDGDDYQSRLFWLRACDLFDANTHVVAVAYEEGKTRVFDDVVVYYDAEMTDEDGERLVADHIQAKFHRWPKGVVTWEALMDPAFIGAERVSLLERRRDAHRQHAHSGGGRRFILDTPWMIDPHDSLAGMLSLGDERIHLDAGAGAGPRSSVRHHLVDRLLEHLSLAGTAELVAILHTFRVCQGVSLREIDRRLDARLRSVGLQPVEAGRQVHPYDDLTRRCARGACISFTREDIEQICKRERLWSGHTTTEAGAVRLGIRSFARRAEGLAEETDEVLDVLAHFDGRFPGDGATWDDTIFPAVERFLAHGSIAFAAGYCLDAKASVAAVPVQSTTRGPAIWRPAVHPDPHAYPPLVVTERRLSAAGHDMAVALGVTKEIGPDVVAFAQAHLPDVGRVVAFTPPHGAGPEAVLDGTHAHLLAQQVARFCQTSRTPDERRGLLHLFAAAPNGMLFFFGQQARGLGRVVWFEFEFERNEPTGYRPALTFPPRAQRHGAA